MSSIKFDYRTQSSSIERLGSQQQQQQQQFIYRFRLYKGLVQQIATKLVEAGQDKKKLQQITNILEKRKT